MNHSLLIALEENARAIASFGVTLREAVERLSACTAYPYREAESSIRKQMQRHTSQYAEVIRPGPRETSE